MGATTLQKAAEEFANWQCNKHSTHHSKCFSEMLYELICKADSNNLSALRRAFPMEVAIYEEWRNSPTEIEFYKKFKLA